jgi:hypothetical protein
MTTAKMRRLIPYMSGKGAVVLGCHSFQVLIPIENCNNISFAAHYSAQVRRNLPRKFISGVLPSQVRRPQKKPQVRGLSRARIFKLKRRPRNDSKEPIPPGCVACGGPIRQSYSYSVPSPLRLFKNSNTFSYFSLAALVRQDLSSGQSCIPANSFINS